MKDDKYKRELLEVIQKVSSNKKLLDSFFMDIFTPREYKEITKRWQIVRALAKGIPQREIAESLKVSIATITRGSRMLLNKKGGFNKALKKFYETV